MEITREKQTKLYDAEKGLRGNCMVATYANFLGLKISDCPAFEELFACTKPNGFWYSCVELWWKHHGYEIFHAKNKSEIPLECEYYFAYGISNRDVMHQVIYKNGELFFDPHPSNDGILTEEGFEYVIKLIP